MRPIHLLDSADLDPFCGAAQDDGWSWTISLAETTCVSCRRVVSANSELLRRWNAQNLSRARTARPGVGGAVRRRLHTDTRSPRGTQPPRLGGGERIARFIEVVAVVVSCAVQDLASAAIGVARRVACRLEPFVRMFAAGFLLAGVAVATAPRAFDRRRGIANVPGGAGRFVMAHGLRATRRL